MIVFHIPGAVDNVMQYGWSTPCLKCIYLHASVHVYCESWLLLMSNMDITLASIHNVLTIIQKEMRGVLPRLVLKR